MHAFLIALEGYIDTIHSMFTDAPLMGFVILSIPLGGIAIVFQAARLQHSQRRMRPHASGPASGGRTSFSDADGAVYGRTSPLFTGDDEAPGEWDGGHSHFMNSASDFEPSVNINGMPMIPGSGIDIAGNPYGVT
jgi:hypothetical protein